MGFALTGGQAWNMGYRYIALIQTVLTAILFFSLPLWKKRDGEASEAADGKAAKALTLRQIIAIPGAKAVLITFFCYCALEQTAGLWASSYLALFKGYTAEAAAEYAALFYIGITVGRALSGFLTLKFNDVQMIRLGAAVILLGLVILLLPLGGYTATFGLVLIGFGCAPIYPCVIHSTPAHFGADKSQAVIGVQMAFAYVGTSLMPPLFGLIANHIHVALLPVYLLILLLIMAAMHEKLLHSIKNKAD